MGERLEWIIRVTVNDGRVSVSQITVFSGDLRDVGPEDFLDDFGLQ